MTFRDDILPTLAAIRAIPGQMGLRPYSVAVLLGTWSGSNTGRGATIDEALPIVEANGQNPKVRELNTEELALGGLGKGAIRIGPITPNFTGGGTPLDQLQPAVATGQTVHLLVTGPSYPNGAKFEIKSINADRALHWTITAEPRSEMPA